MEKLFRKLGFSEYEIKSYLALNKLETASASEIAKESKVPRNKAYEVLEKLRDKGFVMELPTKPRKFKILSLDRLKEVIEEKKQKLVELEKEADKVIHKLSQPSLQEFQEMVWIIKGQKNIVQKIISESKKVKHESLSSFRHGVNSASSLREIKASVDRGVKMKFIALVKERNKKMIQQLIDLGAEVRAYNEELFGPHGTRFSVFDDNACRITIGKPEVKSPEDYITIWSESPSVIKMFKRQFYDMWDKCLPAEEVLRKL